ncbi:hypothetical protein [Staphylococcus aureus]|uniref:hypothetical protein n=1 Tax=Staphylococcus aureus TaxID=1280 RepID=UPI0038B396CF
MAEPMRKQSTEDISEEQLENQVSPKKKKGIVKRGYAKFKEDVKHGSRVEQGSLIDEVRKFYRSIFPKR